MELTAYIGAAAILGIAGSLHCIGMCGPLVMAFESISLQKRWSSAQLIYHAGRWTTYTLLGTIIGVIGQSFAIWDLQRWAIFLTGLVMLLFILLPSITHRISAPLNGLANRLRSRMSATIKSKRLGHRYIFGLLNGLLPCGLVYTALAGSLAAGEAWIGGLFMLTFGISTTPGLLAVSKIISRLKVSFQNTTARRIQLVFSIIAVLILLRGANLGIPYLSPQIKSNQTAMECCHK